RRVRHRQRARLLGGAARGGRLLRVDAAAGDHRGTGLELLSSRPTAGVPTGSLEPDVIRLPPRRVLAALCTTEVVSWGILYYAFPVALSAITADTGWSASATTAAF